jgi:hypothetical protein
MEGIEGFYYSEMSVRGAYTIRSLTHDATAGSFHIPSVAKVALNDCESHTG